MIQNREKITGYLFYLAWTIELVLMIVEKSEILFPLESYVFRATFLLTLLAVALMPHDKKEWIVIAVLIFASFYAYRHSGKNDLLRFVVFVMAARDIDLKKAMKYTFYVCASGFGIIMILSLLGILGDVSLAMDYGRGAVENRFVFGFGHPNTLFGCVYALLLMWIWLYGSSAGFIAYGIASFVCLGVAFMAATRTGFAVTLLTIVTAVVFRVFKNLGEKRIVYILEALVSPVLCIVSAVLAALLTESAYTGHGFWPPVWVWDIFWSLDAKLNYRMSSIYYSAQGRDAVLSGWQLFSGHDHEDFFDMGWVRLFYWYGIIPTAVIALAILAVIYVCWKKKDIWTMVILFSLSVYTVIEATYVTRYFGRDFYILILGSYLGYFFREIIFKINKSEGKTYVQNT